MLRAAVPMPALQCAPQLSSNNMALALLHSVSTKLSSGSGDTPACPPTRPVCHEQWEHTLFTVGPAEKQQAMNLPPTAGLEPSSPEAPLPPADRANTAFTAELAAAVHDLISDS